MRVHLYEAPGDAEPTGGFESGEPDHGIGDILVPSPGDRYIVVSIDNEKNEANAVRCT